LYALVCGTVGPGLLSLYFAAPAFIGWPFAGSDAERIALYAMAHRQFFFAGAWLQATGALLSVLFFVAVAELSASRVAVTRIVTAMAATVLLVVVLVEGAFLTAVPLAAANHDLATVSTAFALSNGVFVRVFATVPAPLLFAAAGMTLWSSPLLPRGFATSAWIFAGLFEAAGIAAIFSQAGFIAAILLSVVQQFWIVAAAIAIWRRRARQP
jgi:hypothetical protein